MTDELMAYRRIDNQSTESLKEKAGDLVLNIDKPPVEAADLSQRHQPTGKLLTLGLRAQELVAQRRALAMLGYKSSCE